MMYSLAEAEQLDFFCLQETHRGLGELKHDSYAAIEGPGRSVEVAESPCLTHEEKYFASTRWNPKLK